MKHVPYLVVICVLFYTSAFAGKKTNLANSGQGWSVNVNWNPGVIPQSGDSVTVPTGKTVTVKTNVYNSSPGLYIVIYGNLDFAPGGKLVLGAGSVIIVMPGGSITSTGSSSEIISINGVTKFNAGVTNAITGPAYADQFTGTSPVGFNSSILKVKQIDVTANFSKQHELSVNWAVTGETESNYYNVEISSDKQNWSSAYKQTSLFNNLTGGYYSAKIQTNISGVVFIRVRETDLNGSLTYSEVISVKSASDNQIMLNAYPVPAASTITLSWGGTTSNTGLSIKVYSVSGVMMIDKTINNNTQKCIVDVQHLPRGWYLVSLTSKDGLSLTKAILLH